MSKYNSINAFLSELFKNENINEFSEKYEISKKNLTGWLTGATTPNEESLFNLAEIFRLPYNFFIGLTDTYYTLLAEKRIEKGYTINELSKRTGIDSKSLRDYESHFTFPNQERKGRIIKELECPSIIFIESLYDSQPHRYNKLLANPHHQRPWLIREMRKFEERGRKFEIN
ncbi:MAG: helix-turn-helix domain-containing protein [archaeon]